MFGGGGGYFGHGAVEHRQGAVGAKAGIEQVGQAVDKPIAECVVFQKIGKQHRAVGRVGSAGAGKLRAVGGGGVGQRVVLGAKVGVEAKGKV